MQPTLAQVSVLAWRLPRASRYKLLVVEVADETQEIRVIGWAVWAQGLPPIIDEGIEQELLAYRPRRAG